MAILTLEDEDIANVLSRFNFKYVDNPFEAEDVRDTMLLGSATDYVFFRISNAIDRGSAHYNELTPAQQAIVNVLVDTEVTTLSLNLFFGDVLNQQQRSYFKRAILWRLSALLTTKFSQLISENSEATEQTFARIDVEKMQESFNMSANEDITSLRDSFTGDLFHNVTRRRFFAVRTNG